MRTLCALLATLAVLLGTAAAPAGAVTFHPGAASLGDPLAPGLGNGGYDVTHYDLRLDYRPATGVLTGTATIIATLTQNLSRFDLDFALPARSVTVDGTAARFGSRNGPQFSYNRDLVVTPAHGLHAGDGMTVVVRYSARPAAVLLDGASEWTSTPTGIMAWDEPIAAAQWWFPGNDYPSDKATYDVWVTTPQAYTATTNGRLVDRHVDGGDATSHWRSDDPLSTHVAVLTVGRYTGTHSNFGSVPVDVAVEDGLGAFGQRARAALARTPEVLAFLQAQWGPYPFDAAGGIVVGYNYPSSLETQTRPVYESGLWQNSASNLWVVVHENSHQWFGDSVTFRRWDDIWLAEGFATYSEWVWSQAQHEGTAEQLFLGTYHEHPAGDGIWSTSLDDPPYPLTTSVYQRGAMLLQALRNRVGSARFFTIMRAWVRQHRHANGSTAEFETLAVSVSGQDLASFFRAWVTASARPAPTVANGFPSGTSANATPPASLAAIERADALVSSSADTASGHGG